MAARYALGAALASRPSLDQVFKSSRDRHSGQAGARMVSIENRSGAYFSM
jgi:hypothetical protein